MPHILALDQGTTSSRAILFDDQGSLLAIEQQEHKQFYPQPGWVEHDAEEIWTAQLAVAENVLKKSGVKPADVAALGITNQRETVVLWDRSTGKPLHPAIVWQDRRTSQVCDQIRNQGKEEALREKTGLVIDPYFSATKIAWLLDHVPEARKAAEEGKLACGTIDSWLIYRLTDGALHITDASNASRTQLMDIRTGEWDDQLLDWFHVPRSILPEIRPSSQVYSEVSSKLPLGGIPIAGIAGDQQAALFGQSCFTKGMAKNTYGTGCFMLTNTADEVPLSAHKLLTTVAWRIGDTTEYALEGSVFIGGAVVGWLRDGLGIIKQSAEIEALATSVPDSGGVLFVPAFSGLGAPHWDAYARGTIVGVTQGTTSAHLAHAALESIALQVADLAEAMHSDSGAQVSELRVDGGASVNNALMQMQADLLQAPVVRPQVTETTALGAAYLAGLATGVWPDRASISKQWQIEKRFEPKISSDEAAARRHQWRRAVERAAGWARED